MLLAASDVTTKASVRPIDEISMQTLRNPKYEIGGPRLVYTNRMLALKADIWKMSTVKMKQRRGRWCLPVAYFYYAIYLSVRAQPQRSATYEVFGSSRDEFCHCHLNEPILP